MAHPGRDTSPDRGSESKSRVGCLCVGEVRLRGKGWLIQLSFIARRPAVAIAPCLGASGCCKIAMSGRDTVEHNQSAILAGAAPFLVEQAEAAETAAKTALEAAVHLEGGREILEILELLSASGGGTDAAGVALQAMTRYELASGEFTEILNLVRDVAVWRCQLLVPWNDRPRFIRKLYEVFGEKTLEDKNFLSRLLHAHRRICEDLVDIMCILQQAELWLGRTF